MCVSRTWSFPNSLTGYHLDAEPITAEDPRLTPIVEACAATGSLAVVGAPTPSHISMLAVDGSGASVAYHKMWLSTDEAQRFTPGGEPAVLEAHGWRLGLAICKDTGVPQHASDTAASGIDAYVAGVVERAEDVGRLERRARRIAGDHRVWVAIASCADSTGGGFDRTAGRSGIWNPDGDLVAQGGTEVGAIARATLSGKAR